MIAVAHRYLYRQRVSFEDVLAEFDSIRLEKSKKN